MIDTTAQAIAANGGSANFAFNPHGTYNPNNSWASGDQKPATPAPVSSVASAGGAAGIQPAIAPTPSQQVAPQTAQPTPTNAPTPPAVISTPDQAKQAGAYDAVNGTGAFARAQKYRGFVASKGNSTAPTTGGGAKTAIDNHASAYNEQAPQQPAPTDVAIVNAAIDPIVQQYQDDRKAYEDQQKTSLVDDYKTISAQLGIPAIDASLLNIKNIMAGTEDDVRTEITKAGGFATESQVQGMVYARNKGLIKQAQFLQDQSTSAHEQLTTLVGLDEKQQTMAQTRFDTLLNLDDKIAQHTELIHKNAVDAYNNTITEIGYNGLALGMSPAQKRATEIALQKPAGFLDNPPLTSKQVSEKLAQDRFIVSEKNADRRFTQQLAATTRANDLAKAREISLYSGVVNKTIAGLYPTGKSPIQTYNNSSQSINRVNEAYKMSTDPNNKNKAAPDLELIDSYISIAKGGQQQITEGQVNVLLSGLGIKAKWDVTTQKITGTGSLDNGTRKSIYDLTHKIYDGQGKLATDAVSTINQRLTQQGVPETMLFTSPTEVDTNAHTDESNPPTGQTTTMNGKVYVSDGNQWVLQQ